jgi:hypothetical protein
MRPVKGDYGEYYQKYIDLVKGDDIFRILVEQNMESQNVLNSFSESKGNHRYAEGKWTVKEVIGHMMDVERIFAYRAFVLPAVKLILYLAWIKIFMRLMATLINASFLI